MQLKGRRHTSYVAKWGDPNSLTAVMNRSTNVDSTVTFLSNEPPGVNPSTATEPAAAAPTYAAPTLNCLTVPRVRMPGGIGIAFRWRHRGFPQRRRR